ncbi:hypothetical protein SEEN6807_11302 [Salmonella enterica subsp. enterica serovar Newport str. 36807]|nr:hypothetical protein SEEN6807_11302 [Salmonella enterica subsp. enterica serovar Newport str. 36807]
MSDVNKQRFSIRKNRITLATRDAASDFKKSLYIK